MYVTAYFFIWFSVTRLDNLSTFHLIGTSNKYFDLLNMNAIHLENFSCILISVFRLVHRLEIMSSSVSRVVRLVMQPNKSYYTGL